MLCQHTGRFGISSKLQEVLCLLAPGYVFEEAEEILRELPGSSVSAKQIQRVSEPYGAALEEPIEKQVAEQSAGPLLKLNQKQEPVYVMVDGSMVYSREQGGREMKVGRLFAAPSRVQIQQNRGEVMQSLYVCHWGEHREFLQKWESYLAPYQNKIILADGAQWIGNRAEEYHTAAVQIVDFYHAVEKLGA